MFAGLFGLYLIRDEEEDALNLPKGQYEIPLILYDRSLRTDGQLFYPVSGDPAKPWVSEFFGQAILVNGALFPFLDVEPRRYRFRLLNASNSRFYYLSLSSKQPFWQIGSDQGLLSAPVALEHLTLAPGERADVILDFAAARGQRVVLSSDRYTILEFRVWSTSGIAAVPIPGRLRTIQRINEQEAVKTRLLSLDGGDSDDPTLVMPMLLNGAFWHDPVTENPTLDTVEIWSLINTTDDSHPIHLHLVRFQILDRRSFDVFTYLNDKELRYTAPAVPPDANEFGWKDVVRADPGMVTRIIVRFEGFAGRYVWHCHVLEHEDFEMMRPYEVVRSH
jgi:spore coat protein A